MTPLLILIAVIVLAGAWLLDRRDKRHQDDRNRLLTLIHTEREAMAQRAHDERIAAENARASASPDLDALMSLVRDLCQRVQAPKEAIVQHQMETGPVYAPPAVLPDDDEGWYAARMSKEDLARQVMDEELAARGAAE